MKVQRIAIIGAGELGQTIQQSFVQSARHNIVGFFDDFSHESRVRGVPIIGTVQELLLGKHDNKFDTLVMGIGYKNMRERERVFCEAEAQGYKFDTLIHPSTLVASSAVIGRGSVVFAGCNIDQEVEIGRNVLLNLDVVVAHNSTIGDQSFIAPAVKIAGRSHVGVRCFLGIGSILIDHVTLGDDCKTGGGCVVTKSFDNHVELIGIPARAKRPANKRTPSKANIIKNNANPIN